MEQPARGHTTCSASLLLIEQDDMVHVTFEYLDFPTLLRIQRVCLYWNCLVHQVIPGFLGSRKFTTEEELYNKVREYYSDKFKFADEIARTYGWPIGKWNVSQVTNFHDIFECLYDFNEDIGDWDMSNATNLAWMFNHDACSFNQDLSKWNTSQVASMQCMFFDARSFNGNTYRHGIPHKL
mmetsp:Transcript_21699/g.32862  ORF Transcript_21699/g.32862 Transcript_21699/m.32862 type:complete len:181 (-) Transcript_21699:180-722(-)